MSLFWWEIVTATALLLYFGGLWVLWRFQERFIFWRIFSKNLGYPVLPEERVTLKNQAGNLLEGVFIPHPDPKAPLLLFFDGNRDDATWIAEKKAAFPPCHLATINYRGYGNSEGLPTQEGIFEDALLVYDHFRRFRQTDPCAVIALGRSLGTGVASYLASRRPLDGLILVTPFDSIRAIASRKYPFFPIKRLLRHPFDSQSYLQDNRVPTALFGVINDTLVPNRCTRSLRNAISHLALEYWSDRSTHATVFEDPHFFDFIRESFEAFKLPCPDIGSVSR